MHVIVIARSVATKQSQRRSNVMGNYWVYIMTNKANTVLYTGMTNNLHRRVQEHLKGQGSGFTAKYRIKKLVFYEKFNKAVDAIAAEKRIKAGSRNKKEELINSTNPEWNDLYEESEAEIASLRSQ